MTYVILLFAILIALGGIVLLIRPDIIFGVFKKYGDKLSFHLIAIIVRLLLGVALVMGASESRYPLGLQAFGWLSIIAALALAVIGRAYFKEIIGWALKLSPKFQRSGGILGILTACFLAYAVL